MGTATDSGLTQIFAEALRFMQTHLKAERLLILFDKLANGDWKVRAAEGLRAEHLWTEAPVSLSLIERVQTTGRPLLTGDLQEDPDYQDSSSVLLSGIRSVLCIPLIDGDSKVRGLLYADHTGRKVAFNHTDLIRMTTYARDLERRLWRTARTEPEEDSAPSVRLVPPPPAAAPPRPAAPPSAPRALARAKAQRLGGRGVVLFLRSLATMMAAGLPLARLLDSMSRQGEDPAFSAVCTRVLTEVERGQPLWSSLQTASPSFQPFHLNLIRVGENTGGLVEILGLLADHEERRRAFNLRLQGALTYPLCLFAACLAMLLLGPPLLLKGQLQALEQLGGHMPMLSRVVYAVANPAAMVALAALLTALLVTGWRVSSTASGQGALHRFMLRAPHLGSLWRLVGVSRFGHALSLQLTAGVPVLEAVPEAGSISGSPVLQARLEEAEAGLRGGQELSAALEATGFFPRGFVLCLAAGEESGSVPSTLAWLSRFYQLELEAAVETAVAALEPTMMLMMGIVGALVALATMLPMVQLVQAL